MSTQVNIRLDEDLLEDIDALARVMHVSRSEYIKFKLARALQEDTLNMTDAIILEYVKGRISDKELNDLLGRDAQDVKFILEHLKRGKEQIDEKIEKGSL